jgi:hypothetical protein
LKEAIVKNYDTRLKKMEARNLPVKSPLIILWGQLEENLWEVLNFTTKESARFNDREEALHYAESLKPDILSYGDWRRRSKPGINFL